MQATERRSPVTRLVLALGAMTIAAGLTAANAAPGNPGPFPLGGNIRAIASQEPYANFVELRAAGVPLITAVTGKDLLTLGLPGGPPESAPPEPSSEGGGEPSPAGGSAAGNGPSGAVETYKDIDIFLDGFFGLFFGATRTEKTDASMKIAPPPSEPTPAEDDTQPVGALPTVFTDITLPDGSVVTVYPDAEGTGIFTVGQQGNATHTLTEPVSEADLPSTPAGSTPRNPPPPTPGTVPGADQEQAPAGGQSAREAAGIHDVPVSSGASQPEGSVPIDITLPDGSVVTVYPNAEGTGIVTVGPQGNTTHPQNAAPVEVIREELQYDTAGDYMIDLFGGMDYESRRAADKRRRSFVAATTAGAIGDTQVTDWGYNDELKAAAYTPPDANITTVGLVQEGASGKSAGASSINLPSQTSEPNSEISDSVSRLLTFMPGSGAGGSLPGSSGGMPDSGGAPPANSFVFGDTVNKTLGGGFSLFGFTASLTPFSGGVVHITPPPGGTPDAFAIPLFSPIGISLAPGQTTFKFSTGAGVTVSGSLGGMTFTGSPSTGPDSFTVNVQ